ncbi:ABC-type multidrug transport system, permease component [Rubellimicrobium mesophilum DSM 19309]|uniref:ABC-type multidrug transport system, permease component n=1 Tax=Rubellimicrobium mesophilum DSM 19309 TaxID=442562 RepID=A0A017HM01_9RHOB|nr:ABC-type multidrug transport system, permease component [Rubellimicrobium mesophilum DSM 19309]
MNLFAVRAIYVQEMGRFFRTVTQSLIAPVLSTSLYFVVFGAAIGGRIQEVEGVSYGAFIVPGLIMLSVITQGISNASFGIYFPKFIGTIFEILSAPVSFFEAVLGYVGAAASKSFIIGIIILVTSWFFVDIQIAHPFAMLAFLVLTCVSFALLGFIIGIWASNFEQLQLIPLLVISPLVFLGGRLLLHLHAAGGLAEGGAHQSGGLPDLGLPLVVLRHGGRAGGGLAPRHRGLHRDLPERGLVDLPHGLAAPALSLARAGAGA